MHFSRAVKPTTGSRYLMLRTLNLQNSPFGFSDYCFMFTKINKTLQVINMIVLVNNAHNICQINNLNINKYKGNIRFSHHSLCLGIFVLLPVGAGEALTPAACFCVVSMYVPGSYRDITIDSGSGVGRQ